MTWNRLTLRLGAAAIVLSAFVLFTPTVNTACRLIMVQPDIQPADAIVVLGSGLMRDGSLTYESAQRLSFGMQLYKDGLAPLLIVSGPPRPGTAPESAVRARVATESGIPADAILQIPAARTTREEAAAAAALLIARHGQQQHVLLVTEALHMLRAKLVFEASGVNVFAAPSDNFPRYATSADERLLLLRGFLLQSAGLVYYRLAGYVK
jgi:uncharacterized SAM-binding protein YcdF (DUF218 family)